ncbi:MAG: M20/M25/M40 family metallo-hydrolase [Actinobacteria bacterium]|jgi:acetylornithine deacetylase/succinyl-diaminopimelate desuccinylase-like protein|nr:M20/M25/M40 family metallo-hydrolase [Actinomycetota bacterium]
MSNAIIEDAIRICQDLIRIPSVNYGEGKGDEKAVADYVVASLAEVGIEAKIYESAPNRCNVIANIEGQDQTRPGLVLHGHIDVVPAAAEEWQVDPFSAIIKDGAIWGRGAVDMKNVDAMILAIVRYWARNKIKPPRNIVLAFFADEEAGSTFGSRWMAKEHPEVFKNCSQAVSEVGGFSVTLANGKRLYMIEAAQKGIHWVKLTAHGQAGHGSFINNQNPVTALSEAVTKIGNYEWPQTYTKAVKELFTAIADALERPLGDDYREFLVEIPSVARMIAATLQNTANPTMLDAGYKANVIPKEASAVIDGRFLPGHEDALNRTIAEIVGPEIKIETVTHDIALEVPFEGELVEAMKSAILKLDPEGIPVPYLMSGGTDNKALSELGIVGYGFSPLRLPADLDFMALFHGVDERIPLESLEFGVKALEDFLLNC